MPALTATIAHFRSVAGACILFVAVAAAPVHAQWQDLVVRDAGFSVLMRGEPEYDKRSIPTPAGPIVAHLYASSRRDSVVAIGYTDYPLGMVVGGTPEQVFAPARETWVKRVNGKIRSQDNRLKLDGKHPGMEFFATGRNDGVESFVQARFYLVEQRLYQIVFMGRDREVPQGVVNRFLNSFKLVPVQDVQTMKIAPPKK